MSEELEIEIDPTGNVKVHVRGRKGKACLDYVQIFQQILGEVKDQQLTSEYYESEVQINSQMKVNTR